MVTPNAETIGSNHADSDNVRPVSASAGSNQALLQVYGRAGQPCGRCGAPIERIVVGGRGTHFCPTCQRLPG